MKLLIHRERPLFWFDAEPSGGGVPPAPASPAGAVPSDEKKFTQADVNRFNAESNRKAEEKARNELLELLGVKSPEEAKTALETFKRLEDEKKSELEKAQAEIAKHKAQAEKAKSDAEAALKQANEKLLQSAVLLEAQRANVDDSEIKSVWRELRDTPGLLEKVKPTDTGDFDGVGEVVKEIVKAHPKWLKGTSRTLGTPTIANPTPKPNEPSARRVGGDL